MRTWTQWRRDRFLDRAISAQPTVFHRSSTHMDGPSLTTVLLPRRRRDGAGVPGRKQIHSHFKLGTPSSCAVQRMCSCSRHLAPFICSRNRIWIIRPGTTKLWNLNCSRKSEPLANLTSNYPSTFLQQTHLVIPSLRDLPDALSNY